MTCNIEKERLLDLVESNLQTSKEIELRKHIENCSECAVIVKELEGTIHLIVEEGNKIIAPDNFLHMIKQITFKKDYRKEKRISIGIIAALLSLLMVTTALATGGLESITDWWKKVIDREQAILQQNIEMGFAEPINLVSEDNGIRMTITYVVADDLSTQIYYEIEDIQGKGRYDLFWEPTDSKYRSINQKSGLYTEQKDAQWGKLTLDPIRVAEKQISLNFDKMVRVGDHMGEIKPYSNRAELVAGDWNFRIPIKKSPIITYNINQTVEIEGVSVKFEQLVSGPTIAILKYRSIEGESNLPIQNIGIQNIKSNGKDYELSSSSSSWEIGMGNNNRNFESYFQPIYNDNPEQVIIEISGITVGYNGHESFEIGPDGNFPQQLNYYDNEISIENVTHDQEGYKLVLIERYLKQQQFKRSSLMFGIDGNFRSNFDIIKTSSTYINQEGKEISFNDNDRPTTTNDLYLVEMRHEVMLKEFPKQLDIWGINQLKEFNQSIELKLE